MTLVEFKVTSHMRLSARDQYNSRWERRSRSKFASHYPWGTNGVCECCQVDVKVAWIPTWHQMDHVSWSLGLFWKTISWKYSRFKTTPRDHGTSNAHNNWYIIF
jgi:hypothetical protein